MLQCRLLAAESLGAVAGASGTLRQLLGLSLRRSDCPSRALSRPSISLPSPRPSSSRQFPLNSGIARRGPQSFAPAAARREDPPPASPRRAPVPGQPRRFMSGSTVKRPLTGSLAGTPSSRLLTSAAATGPKDVVGMTWPTTAIVPQIEFKVADTAPLDFSGDLLALGLFESAVKRDKDGKFLEILDPVVASLDESLGGVIAELAAEPEFKGKPGQKSNVVRLLGKPFKRLALVGLGKLGSLATADSAPWQGVGASVAGLAKQLRAESAALAIIPSPEPPAEPKEGEEKATKEEASSPPPEETPATRGTALAAAAKGVVLGSFTDIRFKSEEKDKEGAGAFVKEFTFLFPGTVSAEDALFKEVRVAAGVILARELVNAPANVLTPAAMAQVAVDLAAAHSDVLEAKILSADQCAELGMGAYLAVGAASELNPPHFIHLTYTPPGANAEDLTKLAIIGKGLTFDSGGYNLKAGPGSMIQMMKFDMGGAAATLGAAKAVAAIQPPNVQVHFIIAACENMISGTGMRPGDILTASNGKTIEVNNTDAEGRLTLADALCYACKLKVDKIVDLATLTGACIIALGNDVAGLFTPYDSMEEELKAASKATGEKLWRMPMEESYFEGLKSACADMVNTGPRDGGSITASLFLKQYVDEGVPWAHLDIAGTAWNWKKNEPTGYGASLMYKWVEANANKA